VVPTWVTTANAQLPSHTTAQASAADASAGDIPRNALTAPLKALDGRTIGSVQLFNRRDGEFTDIDQAMLTHLAELTAAALERTQLYAKP
jgi:GAF domain-containing protein